MKKLLIVTSLIVLTAIIIFHPSKSTAIDGPQEERLTYESAKDNALKKAQNTKSWRSADIPLPEIKEMPPEEVLSPKVAFIVGLMSDKNELTPTQKKQEIIRRDQETFKVDTSTLSWEDQQALYAFFDKQPKNSEDQLFFHSLKNDILLLLMRSKKNPEQLGRKMNDMVLDENQHFVWREYVVQFIPDFVERELSSPDLSSTKEDLLIDLTETMWKMTEETRGSLSGTALMKLNDLSQSFTSIDRQKIREKALDIASNDQVDSASRMGALRVMTENKWDDQLEGIQQIALDDQAPVILRMSAIHSALQLNADKIFKEQLRAKILDADEPDKRLKFLVEKIN